VFLKCFCVRLLVTLTVDGYAYREAQKPAVDYRESKKMPDISQGSVATDLS